MRRVALLLPMLALVACATLEVATDYDHQANFSRYQTYAWLPGTEVNNPLVAQRIHNAIDGQLAAKGLRKAESSPDLLIATHASIDQEKQINVDSFGYGYGRWGAWGGGSTTVNVQNIQVGTLIVDLIDASSKQLVWRGVARDTINKTVSQEKAQQVALKLFEKYPPTGA